MCIIYCIEMHTQTNTVYIPIYLLCGGTFSFKDFLIWTKMCTENNITL